jgi:hypothetical protein
MDDLPTALVRAIPQHDRRHRAGAGSGPITRSRVDVSRPQALRTMIAEAAIGRRTYRPTAMNAYKSRVFDVASAHLNPQKSKADGFNSGPRVPFALTAPVVVRTRPPGWVGQGPIHRRPLGRRLLPVPASPGRCSPGSVPRSVLTATAWPRCADHCRPRTPHAFPGATGRCSSDRTGCGVVPSSQADATTQHC